MTDESSKRVLKVDTGVHPERNRREMNAGRESCLTDNEKRRVSELMREMFRSKLKKTAASKRVAALVAKEFGKEVSAKTIREYWNEAGSKV